MTAMEWLLLLLLALMVPAALFVGMFVGAKIYEDAYRC